MSEHLPKAASIAGRNGIADQQRDDVESTRYSDQNIIFQHEFTLGGSADVYPPGSYVVETSEDCYAVGGHTAHVRKSLSMIVPTASGSRAVQINADDLEAALKRDVEREGIQLQPGSASDTVGGSAELERYGIERVPSETFVWSGYRYSNESDAVAAAKRAEKRRLNGVG